MVTYLIKLTIYAGVLVVCLALLNNVPIISSFLTLCITKIPAMGTAVVAFVDVLSVWAVPLLGATTLIIGSENMLMLLVLVAWKIVKPFMLRIMDLTAGLVSKLVKDA